jgi:hypothetical protein
MILVFFVVYLFVLNGEEIGIEMRLRTGTRVKKYKQQN